MSALRTLLLVTTLVGALASASTAYGQTAKTKKVAVFVFSKKSPAEAQAMQTLMREQVSRLVGVRMLPGSTEPDQPVRPQALPLVEAGYRALNDKKPEEAEASFQKAYDMLVRYKGVLPKRLMARTLKGLGVARAMSGKIAAGQEMIQASMNMWPDQQAPEYGWDLNVMNSFKEVERKLLEQDKGGIDIVSEPPGAEVRVAGVVKGYTPITVEDVPPGLQWVDVQLDGYKRAGAFVDVKPGAEASQGFALEAIKDKAAFDTTMARMERYIRSKRKLEPLLKTTKQLLGADAVLALRLRTRRGFRFDGYYLDEKGGMRKLSQKVEGDLEAILAAVQKFVSRTIGAPVKVGDDMAPLDAPPQASVVTEEGDKLFIDPNDLVLSTKKEEEDSVTEKWWFWVIVGGATAGVAAMLAVLLTSEGGGQGPVGNVVLDLNAQP